MTLKSGQNNVFATILQTPQSAHETINIFKCEKEHHEEQIIRFGYHQAFSRPTTVKSYKTIGQATC